MRSTNFAITTLRWGLAFVFFYSGIAVLLSPPNPISVSIYATYEIVLAIWLFWGRRLLWSSGLATLTLAAAVILNLGNLPFVYKDIGLALAALALYDLSKSLIHSRA